MLSKRRSRPFSLRKKRNMEYPNRLQRLVIALDSAGHEVSDMEQRCSLYRGLSDDFDVTVESKRRGKDSFHRTVSKIFIRETRLLEKDAGSEQAFVTRTKNTESCTCFFCGKTGQIAKHCYKNKASRSRKKKYGKEDTKK